MNIKKISLATLLLSNSFHAFSQNYCGNLENLEIFRSQKKIEMEWIFEKYNPFSSKNEQMESRKLQTIEAHKFLENKDLLRFSNVEKQEYDKYASSLKIPKKISEAIFVSICFENKYGPNLYQEDGNCALSCGVTTIK